MSWRRCLHPGSSSAWTGASRTSVNAWSVPLSSCASCALPSCPPASSTSCRSILTTRPPARSPSLLKSSRTSPTLPSRWCQWHRNLQSARRALAPICAHRQLILWQNEAKFRKGGIFSLTCEHCSPRDTSDEFSFLHAVLVLCCVPSTEFKKSHALACQCMCCFKRREACSQQGSWFSCSLPPEFPAEWYKGHGTSPTREEERKSICGREGVEMWFVI